MRAKCGVLIEQADTWSEMVQCTRAIEAAGFDSVWFADHFANPFEETGWLEAWTALAGLATATDKIGIGTLVTNIVYRHPAIVPLPGLTRISV